MTHNTSLTLAWALILGCQCKTVDVQPAVEPTHATTPAAEPASTAIVPQALASSGLAAQIRDVDLALARGELEAAETALTNLNGPEATLLRARLLRLRGDLDGAREVAHEMRDPSLGTLVQLELLQGALQANNSAGARAIALPMLRQRDPHLVPLLPEVAAALAQSDPVALLEHSAWIEEHLPNPSTHPDARSAFLGALVGAHEAAGDQDGATAVERKRHLEEPVSLLTPASPPRGPPLTTEERLARIGRLAAAHRSERVLAELDALPQEALTEPAVACRAAFERGYAHRKLHNYEQADASLGEAAQTCQDKDLARRAAYIRAKVVSIYGGLRAVPHMERFADEHPQHSMVDDVLFWAGDLYQRRGRDAEARAYYDRVANTEPPGDYCGDALWRLAWMSVRAAAWDDARQRLHVLQRGTRCPVDAFERSRAAYWLARVDELARAPGDTWAAYEDVLSVAPLGFYAQLAYGRMAALDATRTRALPIARAPREATPLALCPDFLAHDPSFALAVGYLTRGLASDAAKLLERVQLPEATVLGAAHAAALGLEATGPETSEAASLHACGPRQARLLYALLLGRAGALRDAHWRLRTDEAALLEEYPTEATLSIWHAAYPMAFREEIARGEAVGQIPPLFLQALVREESAFDPLAVSWAGAYGLTQLLVSTARGGGRLLHPPVAVSRGEDLLDPATSALLGGAVIGDAYRRYGEHLALVLASYNAGDNVARTWWRRHGGEPIDILAEEMTIKETREYVKRVLRTYGVYRWLYDAAPPALPVPLTLPPFD